MKKISLAVTALSALSVGMTSALAHADNMSGTYQVIKSDCDRTGSLFPGQKDAVVEANDLGIRVGEITFLSNEDGTISNRQEFEAAYDFQVGPVKVHNLGDGFQVYTGTFSNNFASFRAIHQSASDDSSPLVYAGETDFDLVNGTLTIKNTDQGQPQATPLITCVLKKLH